MFRVGFTKTISAQQVNLATQDELIQNSARVEKSLLKALFSTSNSLKTTSSIYEPRILTSVSNLPKELSGNSHRHTVVCSKASPSDWTLFLSSGQYQGPSQISDETWPPITESWIVFDFRKYRIEEIISLKHIKKRIGGSSCQRQNPISSGMISQNG